jgi:hypothetical protein
MLTAAQPGGVDLLISDIDTQSSPVASYHMPQFQAKTDTILTQFIQSGMSVLALPLLFMEKPPIPNTFWIDWSNGTIAPQMCTNLGNLLDKWKSLGGTKVLLEPQWYNEHDFRQWTSWQETLYGHIWLALCAFRSIAYASKLRIDIDLCPEVNNNPIGQCIPFAQRIWTDYTGSFWPNAVPCMDASVSIIPDSASISLLDKVFTGLVPGGTPSGIGYYILHPYGWGPAEGVPYGSGEGSWSKTTYYDMLIGIMNIIKGQGLPSRSWVFGECLTLNTPDDETYAKQCRQFVADSGQIIDYICAWQVTARDSEGASINLIPTDLGWWTKYGF